MERIKELYYDFNNSKEYQELGDMPETSKASNEFYELLKRIPKDLVFDMDNAHSGSICSNEMQGFVYGFKYGVQLMTECFSKK